VADDKPFHNPFGVLSGLRDSLPERAAAPVTPKQPDQAQATNTKTYARAVVRLERTGRGGKEVTVVEHLDINAKDREVWLKALKSSLGCGGVVEGGRLVLQGDQRKRLPALLTARGVRRVVMG
jgi:translation initiation factor 1